MLIKNILNFSILWIVILVTFQLSNVYSQDIKPPVSISDLVVDLYNEERSLLVMRGSEACNGLDQVVDLLIREDSGYIRGIEYGKPIGGSIPHNIYKSEFQNQSKEVLNYTLSENVSYSETFSSSVQRGITWGSQKSKSYTLSSSSSSQINMSVGASFFKLFSASVSGSKTETESQSQQMSDTQSEQFSLSSGTTQAKTRTKTINVQTSFSISPRSSVIFSVIVAEAKYRVPYKASYVVKTDRMELRYKGGCDGITWIDRFPLSHIGTKDGYFYSSGQKMSIPANGIEINYDARELVLAVSGVLEGVQGTSYHFRLE